MDYGQGGDPSLPRGGAAAQLAGLCHLGPAGKSDVGAIKSALKALKGKEKLLIFPEGTRHEEIGEGKTGAAMMAIRTGVPVLPVYIAPERTPFHRTKVYIGGALSALYREPPGHSGGL